MKFFLLELTEEGGPSDGVGVNRELVDTYAADEEEGPGGVGVETLIFIMAIADTRHELQFTYALT